MGLMTKVSSVRMTDALRRLGKEVVMWNPGISVLVRKRESILIATTRRAAFIHLMVTKTKELRQ